MAKDDNVVEFKNPDLSSNDMLTNLIRGSAREMIACAVEAELRVLSQIFNLLHNRDRRTFPRRNYAASS